MRRIALTQRVDLHAGYGERRDALDQRWTLLLLQCGFLPLPLPNHPEAAQALFTPDVAGLLLTGGNDLAAYGGGAPERDAAEALLVDLALARGTPVLGVCRGMQTILHRFGVPLLRLEGHVATGHDLVFQGEKRRVNSYHGMGAQAADVAAVPGLRVDAVASDGVAEAVTHEVLGCAGLMWHPERAEPFDERDIGFIRRFFGMEAT